MTVYTRARPTHTWTPRVTVQLTVLAAAAFVYVTAEMVPVGALPAIAADLRVSDALVGTLLASYALVAALTTVPLVRLTARWPRRTTLLLTLVCLTASQLISALAPNFTVLAGGRVLCALTHGLMWSVIAPIGARLVPATHAGRATTAVYVGTSLALVVGNPLTAAMSELWGWRLAVVLVTVAAAAVMVAAWATLPPMAMSRDENQTVRRSRRHHRNSRLVTLTVLTMIGVAGHFISYTFIVVIIRDVVGVTGPRLAWLLAAFGIAGLVCDGGDGQAPGPVAASLGGGLPRGTGDGFGRVDIAGVRPLRRAVGPDRRRRRNRAVGGGVHRAAADAAVGGHAHRARRSGRGVRPVCRRVPGRNHGRFACRRAALRARRAGTDDRGVDGPGDDGSDGCDGHARPVRSSSGNQQEVTLRAGQR